MRIPLILVFLATFYAFGQNVDSIPIPPPIPQLSTTKIVFTEIWTCGCGGDVYYAGGQSELAAYIKKRISFPSDMQWGNVTRFRSYVEFVVNVDGSLSDFQIRDTKSNFAPANPYILDAFREMPNWIPGELHCDPVRTRVRVPVTVHLR